MKPRSVLEVCPCPLDEVDPIPSVGAGTGHKLRGRLRGQVGAEIQIHLATLLSKPHALMQGCICVEEGDNI